jgi:hypothetical protein
MDGPEAHGVSSRRRTRRPALVADFSFFLEMPKHGEMTHISRPFQIALLAAGVLMAVWFVALRGHSASSTSASSGGSPAAAASTPPAQSQAAPSSIYHGSAPGVEGLTHAIAKAHGAVATSQQNAKQLEEKSAQASGGASAPAASPAASAPQATASTGHTGSVAGSAYKAPATTSAKPAARTATPGKPAGSLKSVHRTPARQVLVERALKEGKIAVILFWNPKGADDKAVQFELRLLEAVHHLIRPVANTPKVRHELRAYNLELQKPFAAFEARANQVTSFGTITHGVQVYGTPTVLIINKHGQVKTLTGLTDAYAIEQTIDEARHS